MSQRPHHQADERKSNCATIPKCSNVASKRYLSFYYSALTGGSTGYVNASSYVDASNSLYRKYWLTPVLSQKRCPYLAIPLYAE
jgi:hypothetical protein